MECKLDKLNEAGIDAAGVVERTGINEKIYLSICKKFLKDKSFVSLEEALNNNDFVNAKLNVHTLKGISANLGFRQLEYLSYEILKSLNFGRYELAKHYNNSLIPEYNQIIGIIKTFNS